MKKFQITLIALLLTKFVFTQTMFNNRIDFGFAAQYITSLIATDSCYYAVGNDIATASPWRDGIFFAKFNLKGEIEFVKTYDGFDEKTPKLFHSDMFFHDGYFYCAGYFAYQDKIKPYLIKFDTDGDTIFMKEYPSAFDYDTRHLAYDGIHGLENMFYLTSVFDTKPQNKFNADIIKIDSSGNHVWTKLPLSLPEDGLHRMATSLVMASDTTIVLSTIIKDFKKKDFVRRNQIIRVDTSGTVLDTWSSPDDQLRHGVHNDIIQTQDGGFAFTMSFGTEWTDDTLSPNALLLSDAGVCKLNNELEEEWAVSYVTAQDPRASNHWLHRLIELDDASLVAVGKYFESFVPDSIWMEDYEMWDYWNFNGWILKLSSEGDSIWSHQYNIVNSPADEHFIWDIEETFDGGFIMCGQAGDMFHQPPPGQQGWLIKTDEWGCIVPGCQVSIEEREVETDYLSIYPNPARDYLNILLQRPNNEKVGNARGRLLDMHGNVVTEFPMWQSNLTYIVPVYSYSAGTYIFQYNDGKGTISSQKVIIHK
jgi:hypothetical protein